MKGFHKRRSTTVTLHNGGDSITLEVSRLPPNRRPTMLHEIRAEYGKGVGNDDIRLNMTFSMAGVGLTLGDQIDAKKTPGMTWTEYAQHVTAELEAANLDEDHVAQLVAAGTQDDDDDTAGAVEDAAGN